MEKNNSCSHGSRTYYKQLNDNNYVYKCNICNKLVIISKEEYLRVVELYERKQADRKLDSEEE